MFVVFFFFVFFFFSLLSWRNVHEITCSQTQYCFRICKISVNFSICLQTRLHSTSGCEDRGRGLHNAASHIITVLEALGYQYLLPITSPQRTASPNVLIGKKNAIRKEIFSLRIERVKEDTHIHTKVRVISISLLCLHDVMKIPLLTHLFY